MQIRHKRIQRVLAFLLVVTLLFSYAPNAEAATKTKVTSVKVTNLPSNTLTLKKGGSKTLKVKVAGSKNVSQAVTYQSSNPGVATVTQKGKVTAKKAGTAKITITSKVNKKKKATVTVTVGTPVTKVALNKNSTKLEEGKSLTLKATITPKKASNKKVIWSTSNAKVATVSQKGVVKAVKAGTAKITATAADGSGKKKTITITVTKKVAVKAVSVVNSRTVKVDLTGTKKLSKSDFAVKLNRTGRGAYNFDCNIENVISTKDQSYLLILEDHISDDESVQVTVAGLGSKAVVYSKGTFSYTDDEVFSCTYDEAMDEDIYLSGFGYSSYKVTNLPNGIKTKRSGNYVEFYGKPKQKGKVISTLVAKDERGNTTTYTITWLIGSNNNIAAAVSTAYYKLPSGEKADINKGVNVCGGSGSYTYALQGNAYGLSMDGRYITGSISAPGTYKLNVKITDAKNTKLSTVTTVTINVAAAYTVSGIVKDLSGNALDDARVVAYNKDNANKYGNTSSAYSNSKGTYSLSLVKGTYNMEATYSYAGTTVRSQQVAKSVTSSGSGYDFVIPVQKVVITPNRADVSTDDFGSWYDDDGKNYGYGSVLYLKPGKYSLTSVVKKTDREVTAKINVTVTEKSVATAVASVTLVKPQKITVKSNNSTINPSSFGTWYDANGTSYGSGAEIYLKPGTYSLTSTKTELTKKITAKINITVTDKTTEATAIVTVTLPANVNAGETKTLNITTDYTYYSFTPTETNTYCFYSESNKDTYGILYDSDENELTSNDDGGAGQNFYFEYECKADQTYYVGIQAYSSGNSGEASLKVEVVPSED